MARKDLLAGVTNEIPMKKDPFCDGMEAMLGEGFDNLEDMVRDGRNIFDQLAAMIPDIDFGLDTDNKVGALDKLKDLLRKGMKMAFGDANELLDCLGTSVSDLFGLDLDKLLNDDNIDFSKYPKLIADQLNDFIDDTLDKIFDKGEKAILDKLKEMENNIDIGALDDLLALAGCFAGHCDRPDKIPPALDIEKKMADSGYQLSGETDLGQTSMDKVQQEHFSTIRDSRRDLDSVVNKQISKIF